MTFSRASRSKSTAVLVSISLFAPALNAAEIENASASVADAYQRAVFVLNLVPPDWDQVRRDGEIIARQLGKSNAGRSQHLMKTIAFASQSAMPPPPITDSDLPPERAEAAEQDSLPRGEAARQVLEQLTRAVGALTLNRLDALATSSPIDAANRLASARDAFNSLAPTLSHADPAAWKRLSEFWQELARLIATPSTRSADGDSTARIARLSREIADYVRTNYGDDFTFHGTGRLIPTPPTRPQIAGWPSGFDALPPGARISRPTRRPRQILNSVAKGALERDMPLSSLGAAAFNNPYVLGEPARSLGMSCNSCHDKGAINPDFVIPGLSTKSGGVDVTNSFFSPLANNAIFDPLDIPDLRGIRFSAPYGRNGRSASLRDFVRNVIVNEFNADEPDPVVLDAIVAYLNEIDFLPNPALNRNGTLNGRASEAARRGESIFRRPFAGFDGASCASCHIPDSNFLDGKRHDIGTVRANGEYARDRALDTPTLLGAAFTAPYFHDGSQPTLRAVIDWFNREFKLNLSAAECDDLTSYVSTVGNGLHPFEPGETHVEEDLEDQFSFLTAFEFLAERKKWPVLANLFRGIALEVRRQLPLARNPEARPILEQLAALMDQAASDVSSERYDAARDDVASWRELYRRNQHSLH